MKVTPETFKDYKAPFVVIQGGLDKLVNPEVAFELYDNCKSVDKEVNV
jgi:acylglycerol lipase